MSKVVVTGANGFVGKHLLKELINNNYEVVAIGGNQVPDIETDEDIEYLTLDLSKASEASKIDFSNFTAVIHLAGMAAVGPSFTAPMDYISTNMGIEVNLFESALKQNAFPRFLIISSGTLYDPKASQPLNEQSLVLPNSPYAVSKLGQEHASDYYRTRGFENIIARPFNHIGPGQGLGFIVPDLAQQIVAIKNERQKELLVGNLDAQRDYTDVRDIVKAYRLLIEKGITGEVYNVCSGIPRSGHEILKGLCAAARVSPDIKQDPSKMRPSDTPIYYGSLEKLTKDTGWEPKIKLEETLDDVIEDWSKNTNY